MYRGCSLAWPTETKARICKNRFHLFPEDWCTTTTYFVLLAEHGRRDVKCTYSFGCKLHHHQHNVFSVNKSRISLYLAPWHTEQLHYRHRNIFIDCPKICQKIIYCGIFHSVNCKSFSLSFLQTLHHQLAPSLLHFLFPTSAYVTWLSTCTWLVGSLERTNQSKFTSYK